MAVHSPLAAHRAPPDPPLTWVGDKGLPVSGLYRWVTLWECSAVGRGHRSPPPPWLPPLHFLYGIRFSIAPYSHSG